MEDVQRLTAHNVVLERTNRQLRNEKTELSKEMAELRQQVHQLYEVKIFLEQQLGIRTNQNGLLTRSNKIQGFPLFKQNFTTFKTGPIADPPKICGFNVEIKKLPANQTLFLAGIWLRANVENLKPNTGIFIELWEIKRRSMNRLEKFCCYVNGDGYASLGANSWSLKSFVEYQIEVTYEKRATSGNIRWTLFKEPVSKTIGGVDEEQHIIVHQSTEIGSRPRFALNQFQGSVVSGLSFGIGLADTPKRVSDPNQSSIVGV